MNERPERAISQISLDALPDPALCVDLSGRILACNGRVERARQSAARIHELVVADDLAQVLDALSRADAVPTLVRLRGEPAPETRQIFVTPLPKQRRLVLLRAVDLPAPAPKFPSDSPSDSEIRLRLAQADRLIASITDAVPALIYVYDLTLRRNIFVNRSIETILGRTPEQGMSSDPLNERVHPDDAARILAEIDRLAREPDGTHGTMEYRLRHASGGWTWMRTRQVVFARDDSGRATQILGVSEDITEWRQIEREREEANARLLEANRMIRQIAENAPVFLYIYRVPARRLIFVNQRIRDILGGPGGLPNLYRPRRLLRRVHPDFRATVAESIRSLQALPDGASRTTQFRFLRRDGAYRWLSSRETVFRDAETGEIRDILGIVEDITEQRDAVEDMRLLASALRESEERFRVALEHSPMIIFHQDRDLRYFWVYESRLPRFRERILGQTDAEIWEADDAARLTEWKQRVLVEQSGLREEMWVSLDGKRYCFDLSIEPLRDDSGNVVGISGAAIDITERKQFEENLRHLLREVRCVLWTAEVRQTDDGQSDWKFQMPVNASVPEFLGLESVDPSVPPWYPVLTDEDRRRMGERADGAMNSGASGYSQQFSYRDCFGRIRWLQEEVRLHRIAPRRWYAFGVVTDITERHRLESQVIQSEKLAALGVLVAGVAHEVNNPLTAVSGNAQLLELHPDPQVRADATTIRKMADRATRVLRSLLTYARGSQSVTRIHCTLRYLVEETLVIALPMLKRSHVEISTRYLENEPEVYVDAAQIEQVLLNLLSNAEHALRERRDQRRIDLETTVEQNTIGVSYAILKVTDNGGGIDPALCQRIFDPFFTTKDVGEGTGLGLSISQGIANAHSGALEVESRIDQGTTFLLRLPLSNHATSGFGTGDGLDRFVDNLSSIARAGIDPGQGET